MKRFHFINALLIALFGVASLAADKPKAAKPPTSKPTSKPAKPQQDEWLKPMDYGPFLQTSVARAGGKPFKTENFESPIVPKFTIDLVPEMIAAKGVVIPVGKDASGAPVTVCFDTDTLGLSGWTGGWLDLTGSMFTNHKGTSQVTLAGAEQFRVIGPGWGAGGKAIVKDERPNRVGPMPPEAGRYQGLYVNGNRVVLSYRIASAEVLVMPGYDAAAGAFVTTYRVDNPGDAFYLAICEAPGGVIESGNEPHSTTLTVRQGENRSMFSILGAQKMDSLALMENRVVVMLPRSQEPHVFTVAHAHHLKEDVRQGLPPILRAVAGPDPKSLIAGGPARWKPLNTAGKLGEAPAGKRKSSDPGFIADTLTLPTENPWNAWLRLTAFDFFADGRAAVCTINGDVWVVSGIDDKLEKLTWTRFATGLYQPMGLRIVDDKVYVRGRDQITRLHDLNADGEADFYENFSNLGITHPSYHGFVFDLHTDADGNFFYARGGLGMEPGMEGHGRLIKLSKDGRTETAIGTGLRAPNGLGAGQGWVTVSDNQGNWIPSSKIHLVDPSKPASFLGFLPHHHQSAEPKEPTQPLVWIPHPKDNSSGGQCFIDSDKWGPYKGQWIHTSFGGACAFVLLPDAATKSGEMPKQGALARLPLDFATGVMRPRFNPKDGQLYLCGVGGGWQTKGTADGGLYRIRYTAKGGYAPAKFAVVPGGVSLTFTMPLDKKEAADPQNYAVEQWNYKWTEKYGSPEFSAKTPGKAGHDEVEVKSVEVSADGRTVTLRLDGLTPVNQMLIQCNLTTADGADFEQEIYATINAVPPQ